MADTGVMPSQRHHGAQPGGTGRRHVNGETPGGVLGWVCIDSCGGSPAGQGAFLVERLYGSWAGGQVVLALVADGVELVFLLECVDADVRWQQAAGTHAGLVDRLSDIGTAGPQRRAPPAMASGRVPPIAGHLRAPAGRARAVAVPRRADSPNGRLSLRPGRARPVAVAVPGQPGEPGGRPPNCRGRPL